MGDGVNIAARLAERRQARRGSVSLDKAYWQVKGRLDLDDHSTFGPEPNSRTKSLRGCPMSCQGVPRGVVLPGYPI